MPDDTATARAPQLPSSTPPAGPAQQLRAQELRIHTRVRHGLRRPHNWMQLVKFSAVGGSGYVVNLCTFAVANNALGLHHIASATIAFVFAVFNNFWWNRHWTFGKHGARDHHAGFQAARFFTVSILAFLVALAILELLVSAGLPAVLAQAISIVAATPLNFVGNKMWTFGQRAPRVS
jgi:dolichol-phosphate mannosyltransferase